MPHRDDDGGVRPEEIARVVVRPLGSVLPLGFNAFGVGIFCPCSGTAPPPRRSTPT